ncbi:MAG: DNA repair protein RecO [Proteobacteria bacterium]|nr:DNA repair protein RecO [Pseudomonadota bacterium]
MIIEDNGIIISIRKFGERSRIVSCLLQSQGIQNGIIRASNKKYSDGLQPGNMVYARWQARISEHLGQYTTLEVTHSIVAVHHNRIALYVLNAVISLLKELLMPHDPAPELYQAMKRLLHVLDEDIARILQQYVAFELDLLQHLGRPLELGICAATGSVDDLEFVSPKSGRAVSKSAGSPYSDRLLRLPTFMRTVSADALAKEQVLPNIQEIIDGLTLTKYFLQRYLLEHYGKKIPEARNILISKLEITQE